jgi:hypothetical protein
MGVSDVRVEVYAGGRGPKSSPAAAAGRWFVRSVRRILSQGGIKGVRARFRWTNCAEYRFCLSSSFQPEKERQHALESGEMGRDCDVVALQRKAREPGGQVLADALFWLGDNLINQSKWSEAELALRECVAIRQKGIPETWHPFNAMSLLGEALADEGRYAEAERLVVCVY